MLAAGTSNWPWSQFEPRDTLSDEQLRVLGLVAKGQSVFFTGPAGTGKSFLLKEIIRMLRGGSNDKVNGVAVTASTGIAGLNIGGRTIHSFAGIGLGKRPKEELLSQIYKSMKLVRRWQTTNVLIIDEISMVDGKLFDKLEYIARNIRRSEKHFGGIQLVLSGDFFQLPPVPDQSFGYKSHPTYAFEAESWNNCIPRPVFLTHVFRQGDNDFIKILTNMRRGSVSLKDTDKLKALSRTLQYPDGIEPCELFPTKADVDNCNYNRLEVLPEPEHAYFGMDSAGYDITGFPITKKDASELLDRVNTPAIILLKIGAQVMLTKNTKEERLVNGSIGKITAFMTFEEAEMENIDVAHKLPGGGNSLDDSNAVPYSCIPNDKMRPLTGHTFSRKERYPVVAFLNGDKLLCTPQEFTIEGPKGNLEARRIQVPLILAWALSIHKSQGQTLARVKINLARAFEVGQAYVALSRVTSMDGLELHNFEPFRVGANERVSRWHEFWESYGDGDWPEEMDQKFMG